MSKFISRDFHHLLPTNRYTSWLKYLESDNREASFLMSWRGGHYVHLLERRIRKHLQVSKKVYVHCNEPGMMHQNDKGEWLSTIDFMNRFIDEPVEFFCNMVALKKTNRPLHYINDMFYYGNKLYLKVPKLKNILDNLCDWQDKKPQKHWDMLLGEPNHKKDFIYDTIKKHEIIDKTILSYYGRDTSTGIWSTEFGRPKMHSAEIFKGHVRYSDVIDPSVYDQSYYTALVETVSHPDFAQFSEKEAKPIMAMRPFVLFGSPGHLKAFRKLGFKTFSPVIDESYDNEISENKRFKMAIESMKKLSEHDPKEVFDSLASVLEHNKKHFLTFDWNRELIDAWERYQ